MKNKLFRAFTLVLLTLTLISQGYFRIEMPNPTEPEIRVCGPGEEEEPLDDNHDDPHSP